MTTPRFTIRRTGAIVLCLAAAMFAASCGGNASKKKAADGATETATEQAATTKGGKLETTAEVQPLLAKYKLTADALKPDGAVWAEVSSTEETVRFLLPTGTKDLRPNFNKMLDAIKAAADDGKIYLYNSLETEFDPALFVNENAVGHRVQYICNGNPVQIYLSYTSSRSSQKPGDKNSYQAYNIHFNYGQ